MKGEEVIELTSKILQGDELIVSSNGNVSRQAYNFLPRPQLYLRGSMGLPVPIGLGLALSQPEKTVIVLTGDGNFLMGLSSITTVGLIKPSNLKILIIDNQIHATTGGQATASTSIDFEEMLKGMGITSVISTDTLDTGEDILQLLKETVEKRGLHILHLKVTEDDLNLENIPWLNR
jgi:thiamine pyrophosphate-dependent acetolactate synthase large subunit-like protein